MGDRQQLGRRPAFLALSIALAAAALLSAFNAVATAAELPLVEAVRSADLAQIQSLLTQDIDVNATEADGTTALHWAAHKGDAGAVELLLRSGAHANATNRYSVTPLALAAGRGNARIVSALLSAGADPNTTSPEGETVLMAAARTGNVDVIRVLLQEGADIQTREGWRGQTALMWAAAENHPGAILTLVELGASVGDRSNGGWTALLFAVRAGSADAVRALLEAGADLNDVVQLPDSAMSDSPTQGTSALVVATMNGHFSLAKYLVERGANPNAAEQGWTALHQVAYTSRPNSGKGMPPIPLVDPISPLQFAKFLLENGADPNARQTKRFNNGERNNLNRIGATPYLLAAKHADAPLMRLLAAHGADPRMPTTGDASPLMVAAGVGIFNLGESAGSNDEAFAAVKLAYELGDQDVTKADNRGYAAIHGAALRGSNPIVQFLADRGADLLAESQEGWTPLRIADGVHYTGTVKRADHTAELLRDLMKDQGLYTAAHAKDVNSVAVVRPTDQP